MLEAFTSERWPWVQESAHALWLAIHERIDEGLAEMPGGYLLRWTCSRCGKSGVAAATPCRDSRKAVFLAHARETRERCRGIGGISVEKINRPPD